MKSIFLAGISLVLFACNSKKESYYPEIKDITESVYASVKIIPEEAYKVYANKTGIIDSIYVQEGDTVNVGQLLFTIKTVEIENSLEDAKLDLEKAQANFSGEESLLQSLRLDIQLAKQQLELDSINFERQDRLWKQNIGSQLDYENAKLSFERSVNNYSTLKKKYAQTKTDLSNSYKKAINKLDQNKRTLKEYSIRAQADGKVYVLFKEEGELINPQEPFGEIGSNNNYKIEMDIDEVDITRLKLGDTSVLRLDAYPDSIFTSVIQKIYPKKDNTTLTFKVESRFLRLPPKLYNGLAGEANIIIEKHKNVLTIPTDFLNSPNTVLTSDGEKEIEIGLSNLEFVEILSGIDSTTALIKAE